MTDKLTNDARLTLGDLESTLGTLRKMARDIEPSYCLDADIARLEKVSHHLGLAEDFLAEVCAENVERQEDE